VSNKILQKWHWPILSKITEEVGKGKRISGFWRLATNHSLSFSERPGKPRT
jgi:hypothetical protein